MVLRSLFFNWCRPLALHQRYALQSLGTLDWKLLNLAEIVAAIGKCTS